MKRFLLWLAQFLNAPLTRSDMNDVVSSDTQTDLAIPAAPVVVDPVPTAALTVAVPTEPAANTDTIKTLLIALGHDVESIWEHVVELAKKA